MLSVEGPYCFQKAYVWLQSLHFKSACINTGTSGNGIDDPNFWRENWLIRLPMVVALILTSVGYMQVKNGSDLGPRGITY